MIIKSISVGNYKNIPVTTFSFSGMIALVSTNNFGKSNVLEAIQLGFDFISASPKTRDSMMRYIPGIPLSNALAGKEFAFSIEVDIPELGENRFVRYGYRFFWLSDGERGARITDETLEIRPSEAVRYTGYLKRKESKCRTSKSNQNYRRIGLADNVLAIDAMLSIDGLEIAEVIRRIQQLSYRICSKLELSNSFLPIEVGMREVSDYPTDDSDIPRALHYLQQERPDQYALFFEAIYELFPEFQQVELNEYVVRREKTDVPDALRVEHIDAKGKTVSEEIPFRIRDDIYRILIFSKYLNQPLSMEKMSTGTKRIFWLLANAVFGNSYGANLIEVDEIETSIHPRMMRNLLRTLRELMGDTAMMITSHSPYLVQYFKPEALYIGVPNHEGIAVFRRVDASRVKKMEKASGDMGLAIGEYIFELLSGDEDSTEVLRSYMERAQ
ncbi:MAG: AAA family ATPase [Lachnospiraceae bacterium]|nr:AAA family ATPase [Lachnospiraceae bacterium]